MSEPLSYEYRYSANVQTGALELSHQAAGVMMMATVRTYVSADRKHATVWVSESIFGDEVKHILVL